MGNESRTGTEASREPDVFSVLDGIDFTALAELEKAPGFTAFADALVQDALNSDLVKELRAEIELADDAPEGPHTFDEMLDPSVGSAWQRIQKWYMRVGNAEQTMKVLEAIGADRFPQLAMKVLSHNRKEMDRHTRRAEAGQTDNYLLRDTKFETLLDMATNGTGFSERVHLVGLLLSLVIAGGTAAYQSASAEDTSFHITTVTNSAFFLFQLYAVLGQRYTRARLSRVIDRMLARKAAEAGFDLSRYQNKLGLVLPTKAAE